MSRVHLRFYEELNEFLMPDKRKRRFEYQFDGAATTGELLDKLGVPRDLVELILVNGDSVDFSYAVKHGDFVSFYPVFESFNVKSLLRIRKETLRRIRFLVQDDLFRLGRLLRMLGYDVLFCRHRNWNEIAAISDRQRRIVLTRDPGVARLPIFSRVHLVRQAGPAQQLIGIVTRFDLMGARMLMRLKLLFKQKHRV